MKKKVLIFLFFVMFFVNLMSVYSHPCDNQEYACVECKYKSDYFGVELTYFITSNGKILHKYRDKDSWTKKSSGFGYVDVDYYIHSDEISAEDFIYVDVDNTKKMNCLETIYMHRTTGSSVSIYKNKNDAFKSAILYNSYGNDKPAYNDENIKSCKYNVYVQKSMGYQNEGTVVVSSDGKVILSQSFSNASLKPNNNENYDEIAKLFNDSNDCPKISVICYNYICTLSTNGIDGYNYGGNNTINSGNSNDSNTGNKGGSKSSIDYDHFCQNPDIKKAVKILGVSIRIVTFVAPIIMLVLAIMDFVKVIPSSDEKALNKAINALVRRFIAAVLVAIAQPVLFALLSFLGFTGGIESEDNKTFGACTVCLLKPNDCKTETK